MPRLRRLEDADTCALSALLKKDPVANVFLSSQLERLGSAGAVGPDVLLLGGFEAADQLASACWIGSNIVPTELAEPYAQIFASHIARLQRRHASIYGPAGGVLALARALHGLGIKASGVRAEQPLLAIETEPAIEPPGLVAPSQIDHYGKILPASVAMFEEEVGYSPYSGSGEFYRRRVASLIRSGHSFSYLDADGEVVFKADLGVLSRRVAQIQGVWLRPEDRGQGHSAGYMADVVHLARAFAPVVSLYVNGYNSRARASYARVGFTQVGTFATVLF
ncbi:DUF4081 domain-containing protein [Acaricomes phytoseiuli]|uniref:GNAT family N-acetyltransferase n=1 Tax=Acaricomes phytoseiuli TaxID=291968 RepID=UPI00036877D8|nr:GNAT family N-acetyltransferase [Acaricomes phytoseiuli]MCW1249820.1 DUF4081 domain-containing protein [Acaricomes phytoseiuli]